MIDTPALAQVVRRLAGRTLDYPFRVWGYGEAIGLEALLAVAEATGDQSYFEFVRRLMDQWIETRPEIAFADHVAPGAALLEVYRQTGDRRYLDQAYRLADFLIHAPRAAGGAALHRPDHPEFSQYIYVDCMYGDAPFLCRLAQATGAPAFYRQAVELLQGHLRLLQDDGGLFWHLYDCGRGRTNGVFWGRGNGWAMLGLIDTLAVLPPDDPDRPPLQDRLARQAAAVAALQDSSGHWHTVLDRADTYLETSLAAFFCAAFMRAVQLGLLPDRFLEPAQAAWPALLDAIDTTGLVTGVSKATPPRDDVESYATVPVGDLYPWGQGPALRAALAQAFEPDLESPSYLVRHSQR